MISEGLQLTFQNLLLNNISVFEKTLKTEEKYKSVLCLWDSVRGYDRESECSSQWKFVRYCLHGLTVLQKALVNSMAEYQLPSEARNQPPVMSPDTLSFTEQKLVKTLVQFVVCLGICRNMEPGVGLSMELRTGFSEIVKSMGSVEKEVKNGELQLFKCVQVLMSCVTCSALGTLILTQHLSDLLAALLQLTHHGLIQHKQTCKTEATNNSLQPDVSRCSQATKTTTRDTSTGVTPDQEEHEILDTENVDYVYCKHALDQIVQKVYPPLLVNTLLLLQGGPKPKVSTHNRQVYLSLP